LSVPTDGPKESAVQEKVAQLNLVIISKMQNSKTVSYFPCVKELTSYKGNGRGKSVLVVGSGCAGLGSAWHLNRAGWDVTMKEAGSRFGGHANTVKGN
jgi:heterodisulfide reductase subunit A-like polyferredoxin